jgi:geranylgeranyl diphosphate synthase type I
MSQITSIDIFTDKLAKYRQLIDDDISQFAKQTEQETLKKFGANARLQTDAYLSILGRGGKRIRGSLAMAAYEMAGGKDQKLILHAARALEMLHAYILIIDDFQDRSHIRRGGPAAHTLLTRYHKRHELAGDAEHFGASIAINAALNGAHLAQQTLAELDIDPELKIAIINQVNDTMVTTSHGQVNDILNEVVADVSESEIERVLEWKTAHYTFLNPLTVGLMLAGVTNGSLHAIHEYAMHAGKAFQITDDILGTFGSEFESGKSPMDDIREGKRTLIISYALEHTNNENKNFLVQMLGNEKLTPVEFERCKDILMESGALDYAQQSATTHVDKALKSLENVDYDTSFLSGLAASLLHRTA